MQPGYLRGRQKQARFFLNKYFDKSGGFMLYYFQLLALTGFIHFGKLPANKA